MNGRSELAPQHVDRTTRLVAVGGLVGKERAGGCLGDPSTENPRNRPEDNPRTWTIVTADNAELYAWPIDLEQGRITLTAGRAGDDERRWL